MLVDNDLRKDLKLRVRVTLIIIYVLYGVLLVNLFVLQVYQAEKYTLLSDKNRVKLAPILPKRGRIITSDGKFVATSSYKYRLLMDLCDEKSFNEGMITINKYLDLTDQEKQRILDSKKKSRPYVVIKEDLSWNEYAKISMILFKLNHVFIENIYVRNYSMPLEFSHILGYTSKSNNDIQILTGKSGIEFSCDDRLTGKTGNIQTEINATGKKIRIISKTEPTNGTDVVITINSGLQKYVYDLIAQEKAGACVVIDMSNAEILSMVSVPGFDSNLISGGMSKNQWKSIINNPLFPLMNRVVSCTYPPGSIFKIVVAFAALSEGIISPHYRVFCSGGIKQDGHVFHCWNRRGHGSVNLYDAIRLSCDCYFFEISKRLGINSIIKYAEKFGFGSETGIELPNESVGLLPTKEWKFLKYGTSWKRYETMITSIGQGAFLSTLMQAAVMIGRIYTDNYNFFPTLIKNGRKKLPIAPMDRTHSDVIKNALYQVCATGTASGSCQTEYGISGKTGSSQVRKIKSNDVGISQKNFEWKYRDHAFFVGSAPHNNPRYIVAVFIEHGRSGASVAAPIARKIFDKLMVGKI
ncbi:MAG: penicillin-binding protein 2 [Holosporaceae bacterium]|jgi:penicillin-binding protein 2|nr:penicillin-binding protein 2 [Holosporaceae bacterium]